MVNDLDHKLLLSYGPLMMRTIRLPSELEVQKQDRTFGFTLKRDTYKDVLTLWMCKFIVLTTMQYRKDVNIWIPPPFNDRVYAH